MKGKIDYMITNCLKCGRRSYAIQDFLDSIGVLYDETDKGQLKTFAEMKYLILLRRTSKKPMKCPQCKGKLDLIAPSWMKRGSKKNERENTPSH
jgi:hypothetical protein